MPLTRSSRNEPGSKPATPNQKIIANGPGSETAIRKFLRSASNISSVSTTVIKKGGEKLAVSAVANGTKITIFNLPEDFIATLLADSQLKNSMPGEEENVISAEPRVEHESADDDADNEDPAADDSDHHSESDASPAPVRKPPTRGRGGRGRGRGRWRGRGRGGHDREPPPPSPLLPPPQPSRRRAPREAAPKNLAEASDDGESAHVSAVEDAEIPDVVEPIQTLPDQVDNNSKSEVTVPEIIRTVFEKEPEDPIEEPAPTVTTIERPQTTVKRPRTMTRENSNVSVQRQNIPTSEASEPFEETLMEIDLPSPFVEDIEVPSRKDCGDLAEYYMKSRYKPMTDPQAFVNSLTKFDVSKRSTSVLYAIAENAQIALKAWQDDYLMLDAMTAPEAHPPKKPATGGRIPLDAAIHEDMKEADLYNYLYDPKRAPGTQDPFAQRLGRDNGGGRELRQRRARDVLGSAPASEDEDENENGVGKRKRRAAQRFEGTATPEFGARGWRKRAFGQDHDAETVEADGRPKRARISSTLLPQRVREMRGESAANSSTEGEDTPEPPKRRGRPPGSKNLQRRSDAGIKKGPRKPVPIATKPMPGQEEAGGEVVPVVRFVTDEHTREVQESGLFGKRQSEYTDSNGKVPITPQNYDADANSARRKQRAKSEKRSASMTAWWAERKARAAENKLKEISSKKDQPAARPHQHEPRLHLAPSVPPPPPPMQQYARVAPSLPHPPPILQAVPPGNAAAYPLTGLMLYPPPQHPPPYQHHHSLPPPRNQPPLAPAMGHPDPYYTANGPISGHYTLAPNMSASGPPPGVPSPYPLTAQSSHYRPGSRG